MRSSLQQVMADNFKAMGGKVLSQEAIAPTDVDMHPVLTRIASEKPDLIYFPVFTAAAAQILRQAKETPGLEKTKLIGGGSLLSADFIEAAGPSVVGFVIGYPTCRRRRWARAIRSSSRNTRRPTARRRSPATTPTPMTARCWRSRRSRRSPRPTRTATSTSAARRSVTRCSPSSSRGSAARSPATSTASARSSSRRCCEFTSADPKTFGIGKNPKKIWP